MGWGWREILLVADDGARKNVNQQNMILPICQWVDLKGVGMKSGMSGEKSLTKLPSKFRSCTIFSLDMALLVFHDSRMMN